MWSVYWDLWLTVGVLIGVVVLSSWAIFSLKRWREVTAQSVHFTPEESLKHYQKMVDDGTLDPQEFARIKDRLEQGPPISPTPPIQPPDTSFREP